VIGELWRKLLFILRRGRFNRELDEEMRFHLEMKGQAAGHYAARLQFGNPTLLKEISREMWRWNSIERLLQDVRYALRMIRRSPGLSTVAILSLALGIGANTAIFSLVDTVMLRMLPVKDPQHLKLVVKRVPGGTGRAFSYPAFALFRDHNDVLSGLIAFGPPQRVRMTSGPAASEFEQISRSFVSGEFFSVLGVNAILGRTFTAEEDKVPGADPFAVLSYDYWKGRFALDPSVIGKHIVVDELPVTIIGVSQPGFAGVQPGYHTDLWLPAMMMTKGCVTNPGCQIFGILTRLKPGVTSQRAQAELEVLHRQHLQERAARIPNEHARTTFLSQKIGLADGGNGLSSLGTLFSKPLLVLAAVVGVVLLIACANVANLLLARAAARRKEIAVRLALGAGRVRLTRQLLTESSVLASMGGVLGLAFAYLGSRILIAFVARPGGIVALDPKPDLRALAFTAVVSIVSGLLFGIVPALRATRASLAPALKQNAKSTGAEDGRSAIGRILVISQVALSLVLLIGAGLFVRSLENLRSLDTGFNRQNVLMFGLSVPRSYKPPQMAAIGKRVLEQVQTLPGVILTGSAAPEPLSGGTWDDIISVEGYAARPQEDLDVNLMRVSRRFFETMGTALLAGRTFESQDTETSPRVALVNEGMARRFFGSASPVGKHLNCSSCGGPAEIIGVVGDSKLISLREETPATAFFLADQILGSSGGFVVRTAADPTVLASAVREMLKNIDRNVLLERPRTLSSQLDEVLIQERMIAKLSGFFGVLALLLASIGLYGVMSYAVVRRTNEIGIRMALGAATGDVLRQILRETLFLVVTGIVLGTAAALSLTRLVKAMLFGLTPNDPVTIAFGTLLLLAVALMAGYLPARRAARVDPLVALRYE
jgi:putative ABC transport system permease protein